MTRTMLSRALSSTFARRLSSAIRRLKSSLSKTKSPAVSPRGFFLKDCDEDVPFLADLAATYSSKP